MLGLVEQHRGVDPLIPSPPHRTGPGQVVEFLTVGLIDPGGGLFQATPRFVGLSEPLVCDGQIAFKLLDNFPFRKTGLTDRRPSFVLAQ
jgi:hypothetical protein